MHITLQLPAEFIALCAGHGVEPDRVLRGFIADLCELRAGEYTTNGSDERRLAEEYYERVGYPYFNEAD